MAQQITYCRDCGWFVTDNEYGSHERSSLAIDHTVASGHEIDTLRTEMSTERAVSAFLD
jgi:hypothetical protein